MNERKKRMKWIVTFSILALVIASIFLCKNVLLKEKNRPSIDVKQLTDHIYLSVC